MQQLSGIDVAMRRIAEQAERAGKVIKSVHDFVRRRDKERERVTPKALLEAIMPLVGLQARKLGVRVQTELKQELPAVLCDRTMVEQVLLNLARNAMQAMDQMQMPAPSLVIGVRKTRDGGGRRQELDRVFGGGPRPRHFRAGQATTVHALFTTKAEGMGLGLSMCRTVVEQHGGFLEFEPNHPQGTIFKFTLPVDPAAARGVA